MTVWMAQLRRGIKYHLLRPDEPKTVCGKFAGRPDNPRGHQLGLMEARDRFNAKECGLCGGSWDRKEPPPAREHMTWSRERVTW